MPDAGASEAGSSAEARPATSDPQGAAAADAEGKGDPTVQLGDRPGGLEGGEDEDSGSNAQKLKESQAAYQRVEKATADLPASLEGKCVAIDGEKTMSGYAGKNPRGMPEDYSEATPDQIRDYSKTIGHDLAAKKPNFMDGLDKNGDSLPGSDGWAGKYNSVHAEKQLGFLKPNDPIAVNKPMCSDCQGFFRQQAKYLEQYQFVTDPNGSWTYQPDGTVTRPDGTIVAPDAPLAPPKTNTKRTSSQLDFIHFASRYRVLQTG
jgi:hypothetical protein